jgi:hypothetical protein
LNLQFQEIPRIFSVFDPAFNLGLFKGVKQLSHLSALPCGQHLAHLVTVKQRQNSIVFCQVVPGVPGLFKAMPDICIIAASKMQPQQRVLRIPA